WNMEETDARCVIKWLSHHELYAEHAHVIADALCALVHDGGRSYAPGLLPAANAIARTLWAALERSETEVPDHHGWLQKAINRPAGRLAEFWLESLSLWRKYYSGDVPDQLSEEYRQALTAIVRDNSIAGGLGRTV